MNSGCVQGTRLSMEACLPATPDNLLSSHLTGWKQLGRLTNGVSKPVIRKEEKQPLRFGNPT